MKRHFTLDVETLSLGSRPVVTSVAVVLFDATGPLEWRQWYLDIAEQIKAGSSVQKGTLEFWGTQNPELFQEQFRGITSTVDFCNQYNTFLRTHSLTEDEIRVWASAPLIDHAGVAWLYEQASMLTAAPHWSLMDARTIRDISGNKKYPATREHEALSDAQALAWEVAKSFELLGVEL